MPDAPFRAARGRRVRALRRVRRALRARDAHGAARRAREGVQGRAARPRLPRRAREPPEDVRGPPDAPLRRRGGSRTRLGGARLWLKREDLLHTGAHKINNAIGQALLTKRMGKTRVIAETGAGPARRRDRDRVRAPRPRVRRLHGRRGRRAPGPQRLPDEAPRRDGRARDGRLEDAQGRDQRGDARLGRDDGDDALRPRLRARAAPVPDDGARFPAVIGREAKRQCRRAFGRLPGPPRRVRGRRLERDRAFPRVPRRTAASRWSASRRAGASLEPGEHAARFGPGSVGVLHGTRTLILQDAGGPGPPDALGLGRARLPGGRARARAPRRARAARATSPCRTRTRSPPSTGSRRPRGSSRPSRRRMPWRGRLREAPRRPGKNIRREPLRTRRQGRRFRREAGGGFPVTRLGRAFAPGEGGRPGRARRLRRGRRPRPRDDAPAAARSRGGRAPT